MKRTSKLLLFILTISLLVCLTVFAASAQTYGGKCGDNLTWSLDTQTGVLDISGNGKMKNYSDPHYVPWYSYSDYVKTVNIGDSVKSIGSEVFFYCSSLTSVTIPDSVTSIGRYAFWGCSGLTSVTIPDSVKSIGDSAFYGCSNLTSVTIPDSVKSIGEDAFYETEYYNNKLNWKNNELYIGKHLINVTGKISGEYTVKNGTYTIADCVFKNCTKLTSIKLPDGLKYIGYNAFSGCNSLTSVKIPDSVTEMGNFVFENCKKLEKVELPGCFSEDEGKYNFENCPVKEIVISKEVANCFISNNFNKVNLINKITLKNNVKTIGNYAFQDCKNVKSITVPNYVESIGWQDDTTKLVISRKKLSYPYFNENASFKESKTNTKIVNGYCDEYFNNISSNDPVTQASTGGDIYALCGLYTDKVLLVSQKSGKSVTIKESGFKCGAGIIGDDNMLYLLWGKTVSDDTFDKSPKSKNVKVKKYSLSGTVKGEYGFQLKKTYSMTPFDAGNAALAYNKGILCVTWNTLWNGQYTDDGLHHQGMEFALIKTSDMSCFHHETNAGSHSFGVYALKTNRGFGVAQLGDASSYRGLNFYEYNISNDTESKKIIAVSSPGKYGTNEKHLDGNDTYISNIGFAESKSTFAFCAFATDIYTSDTFYNNKLYKKAKYDVYVRILDKTLSANTTSDCSGKDRINSANGKVADKNVVKITDYNGKYGINNLKIVSLPSGAYCVLWNKEISNNGNFAKTEFYYAVLDEKGSILKKATKVNGAYISDYNVPPVVQKNKIIWAVCDANNKLNWMTLDLKAAEIKATEIKKTSLKLTWKTVSGAKFYKVEQSTDGKTWKAVKTVDTNSYTVKSLKSGTKYQFRVTALDSTKKITGKASAALKTGTLTAAPTVTVKSTKSKTAVASWKKVTGASKYIVYKSTDGKKWTKVTTTTKLTYTLTKLSGGKKIYVKVQAVNAYGKNSADSKAVSVTVKK